MKTEKRLTLVTLSCCLAPEKLQGKFGQGRGVVPDLIPRGPKKPIKLREN